MSLVEAGAEGHVLRSRAAMILVRHPQRAPVRGLGLPGLLPLAFLVLLPRAVVPRLAQSRTPGELDRLLGDRAVCRAISEALGLGAATQARAS